MSAPSVSAAHGRRTQAAYVYPQVSGPIGNQV